MVLHRLHTSAKLVIASLFFSRTDDYIDSYGLFTMFETKLLSRKEEVGQATCD